MEYLAGVTVRGGECSCRNGVVFMSGCTVDLEVWDNSQQSVDLVYVLTKIFPNFDTAKTGHYVGGCVFTTHLAPVRENE